MKRNHRGCLPLGRLKPRFHSFILLFVAAGLAGSVWAQSSYVNFEGKQTSPVRLSPAGTRLFAVNTPDERLSVFDVTQPSNPRLFAEIPVGIETASGNPCTEGKALGVNEVFDIITVL